MAIKTKQLEDGAALLAELQDLLDLKDLMRIEDNQVVFDIPVRATLIDEEGILVNSMNYATVNSLQEKIDSLIGTFKDGEVASTATISDLDNAIQGKIDKKDLQISADYDHGRRIGKISVGKDKISLYIDISDLATIVSPSFTGTPTAPTPGSLSNDSTIATTAFVKKILSTMLGTDVNVAIKDNVNDFIEELLERYNNLSSTNSSLEQNFQELLDKLNNSDTTVEEKIALIEQLQKALAKKEDEEEKNKQDIGNLQEQLLEQSNISSTLLSLVEQYKNLGSSSAEINNIITNIINTEDNAELQEQLISKLKSFIEEKISDKNDTIESLDDYLLQHQDIFAIVQRLLREYAALEVTTSEIDDAFYNLQQALKEGAGEDDIREITAALNRLILDYKSTDHGLTETDKTIQQLLQQLQKDIADQADSITDLFNGLGLQAEYSTFIALLEQYVNDGRCNQQVKDLMAQLQDTLRDTQDDPDNPFLQSTLTLTINTLTNIFQEESDNDLSNTVTKLLQYYRSTEDDIADINSLIESLKASLQSNSQETDDIVRSLINDIKDQQSRYQNLKDELEKVASSTIEETKNDNDTVIKTIKDLSTAINDDLEFGKHVQSALDLKFDKAGGTVSGDITVTGNIQGNLTGTLTGTVTGTSDKAKTDINGVDIISYINGVSLNGYDLTITDGAGNSTKLTIPDGSENIIEYKKATANKDGLLSKEDFVKLQGIAEGANNFTYTLPKATTSTLGGVIVGNNITVDNTGKISVTKNDITGSLGYVPVNPADMSTDITSVNSTLKTYVKSVTLSDKTLTVKDGNNGTTTFITRDTTYDEFVGSSSTVAGKAGLVPGPDISSTNKFLSNTGLWKDISANDITGLADFIDNQTYEMTDYLLKEDATEIYSPLRSPVFTEEPKAPTPANNDSSTRIATTAFVKNNLKNYQPLSAPLTSIAGLTTVADKIIYTTRANTYATTTLSSFMRTLLSKTSAQYVRDELGVITDQANVASATKLNSARTITVDLTTNTGDAFDGTNDITPGVTGILKVANGGTGQNNLTNVTVGAANKLSTPRTISITGAVEGTVTFDGSNNVVINTTASVQQEETSTPTGEDDVAVAGIDMSKSMLGGGREFSRMRFYQETPNYGALEIAVADNGNEPVYIRQYKRNPSIAANVTIDYDDAFYTSYRTLILLDGDGNSEFPGIVKATEFDGNATTASKFANDLYVITNLAKEDSTLLQGDEGELSLGISGTLPISHGGTGATTVALTRNNLGLGNTSGPVPVANGGTGVTTAHDIRNLLRLGTSTDVPVPVASGGTGLDSSPQLLVNLAINDPKEILVSDPRPGVTGILKVANGGTGQNNLDSVIVGTAKKLNTARTITLSQDVQGSVAFDASKNVTLPVTVLTSKSAETSDKLTYGKTFQTDLSSENAVSFDGTANNLHGITGTLSIDHGGTGLTKSPSAIVDIAKTANTDILTANPVLGIKGILPVANGGTGQNSLDKVTVKKAQQLTDKRKIEISGAVLGSAQFDGTADINISTQLSIADKSMTLVNCTNVIDSANKSVAVTNFTLKEGVQLAVKLVNGNSADKITLNVNNTGAYPIITDISATNEKPFGVDAYNRLSLQPNTILHLTYVATGTNSHAWLISSTSVTVTQNTAGLLDNNSFTAMLAKCFPVTSRDYSANTSNDFSGIHFGVCSDNSDTVFKTVSFNEGAVSAVAGDIFAVRFVNGHHANSLSLTTDSGANFRTVKGPEPLLKHIPRNTLVFFTTLTETVNDTTSFYYNLDYITYHNLYDYVFECTTAANAAAKATVKKANDVSAVWLKKNGSKVVVKFNITNTANNPTLKINDETALPMYLHDGTRISGKTLTQGIWEFIYLTAGISGEGYYIPSSTLASYLNRPALNTFSISNEAWQTDNRNGIGEYVYYYDITATGVTATDIPTVIIDVLSQETAQTAEMCSVSQSFDNAIRLYCKDIPENDITGTWFITPSR